MQADSTARTITVRSSGSGEPGIGAVAEAFSKATGHEVRVTYDDKASQGYDEPFDVVVASTDALEREYRRLGVVEDGGVSIGSMALGAAIRSGAPLPSLNDLADFKRSVADASALILTTHSSGFYIEKLLKQYGMFAEVSSKIERFANAPLVMDRLLAGHGPEFAILSENQIRRYEDRGLLLAGSLPKEAQYSREFIAVPMKGSDSLAVAWAFVNFCGGPGRPLLAASGFTAL